MSYRDLRSFVDALEQAGELHRVKVPVSPRLEITAIADRVSKSPAAGISSHAQAFDPHHAHLGGKALLFEQVEDSSVPLLINAMGSYRRMEMALGCTEGGFADLAQKIEQIAKPQPPATLMDKVKKGLEFAKLAGVAPKVASRGPCQQVVHTGDEVNLFDLPVIQCWPHDGDPQKVGFPLSPSGSGTEPGQGRYITFAGVYTVAPEDAGKPDGAPRPSRNVGMYRMQLIDRQRTAMHWHMHHDGARHWRTWCQAHQSRNTGNAAVDDAPGMPCALVLGGESVLPYAATAPMPPGISELLFAGFLNGSAIELVRCKTIDMHVPAHAEIVIEGYVSTEALAPGLDREQLAQRRQRAELDARGQSVTLPPSDAATDQPPTADVSFGIDHPLLKAMFQGAVFEGPFGDHTGFYSLPDRYPVFHVTAITRRENPIYPTTIVGLPPQEDYYMGKATERLFLPLLQTLVPDIIDYDLPMFGCFHNCAFVKIHKAYPLQARRVMHAIWGAGQMAWTKMIVVVDHDVDVHDHEQVLFHLCANVDPGRDIEIVNGPLDILDHAAPRFGAGHKIGFDATAKIPGEEVNGQPVRPFPKRLTMSSDILQRIEQRWREYGL